MRADRLLSIVLLLQTRGRQTAAQLSAELEVSVRTIYRDMAALGTAGIPIFADPAGYQLVDGYRTNLTGLTADEARGLVLAELPGVAAELGLATAVAAVRLKLSAALPETQREQASRMRQRFYLDAPGWCHEAADSRHLSAVADALWEQRPVQVRYESWRGIVQRRLEPYGLVLASGRWYLVAHAGGDVRVYRVDQIQELVALPDRFDLPAGFDLAAHWRAHVADFRARLHKATALVRLSPAAIPRLAHVLGRPAADAAALGEPQPDGWVRVALPIESEAHAERELLRLGAEVEVLEPASLRQRMATTAATLAELYARRVPPTRPAPVAALFKTSPGPPA